MEGSEKIAYREELKARLRKVALNLIELSKQTPFNSESKVLMNQLLRSGTSVYANYRACPHPISAPVAPALLMLIAANLS